MVQTNAPLCTANDLTGMAALQGASGSLAGTLTVTNSSKRPCAFSHDVTLQILSGSTVLPVVQLQNVSAGSIADLQPGDSVDLRFMWSNWCRAALSAPGAVRLVLASSGYLKVPFIASSGAPQYDSPRCDSQSLQSYVTIR
ncbi:MAG TPA: DUF4232 domain-containing protein [Candidatus Paceibacterota bacterium]|nr:DUF4232 domain-containing protein [Candidatus Paceibacterota bacterium]